VALKVIRSGTIAPTMLRRFTQEADILARLQHVGIAQIYEAGRRSDGRRSRIRDGAGGLAALTRYAEQLG